MSFRAQREIFAFNGYSRLNMVLISMQVNKTIHHSSFIVYHSIRTLPE